MKHEQNDPRARHGAQKEKFIRPGPDMQPFLYSCPALIEIIKKPFTEEMKNKT